MRKKNQFRGAYLVLGSVGWWVRRWIKLEVRVEELEAAQGDGTGAWVRGVVLTWEVRVAYLLRDKTI